MNIIVPKLSFDPNKPFYSLVIAYLAQVHGWIELSSRGCKYRFKPFFDKAKDNNELLNYFNNYMMEKIKPGYLKSLKKTIQGGVTNLIGQQRLASNTGQSIKVNIDELAKEIFNNHYGPIEFFNRMSAGGLLILAWEITSKDRTEHEIWEFFRHCRNAAAHKGFFNFFRGEPKKPAKWKSLEIKRDLQGKPLFPDPPTKGFLGIGDVLYLLADIESTFYS